MNTMQASSSRYSLIAAIRSAAALTFYKIPSIETSEHYALEAAFGRAAPGNAFWIPKQALVRDLTAAVAGSGGNLVGTEVGGFVEATSRLSVALKLGVATETLASPAGNLVVPSGETLPTTTWLATEGAQTDEVNGTFGQRTASPKLLSVYTEVSRQLLLQSSAATIVPYRLGVALARAIDTAVIAGTGVAGQPLGILNTAGIGTFTGSSLDYAAIVNAQLDVADAEGIEDPDRTGWTTTPTVASVLMTRVAFTGTNSPLWAGKLAAGTVIDAPAFASKSVPAGTMVYGDWSGVSTFEWDGAAIEVDPFSRFQSGLVGIRLLVAMDLIVQRPKAFSVATAIT